MSASRRSPTPVIVEMQPSNAATYDPSAPVPSSPPKAVRFARESSGLVRSTRPPTNTEAWSAWRFENHASECARCQALVTTHRKGESLCPIGHPLALDASLHFRSMAGEIYSVHLDDRNQLVRVELPAEYWRVRRLLRVCSREARRSSHHVVPVISYAGQEEGSPSARPKPSRSKSEHHHHHHHTHRHHRHPQSITVEPSTSPQEHRSHTRHRSTRYHTVVVRDDVEKDVATKSKHSSASLSLRPDRPERRASLYKPGVLHSQRDQSYQVEIRRPSSVD